MIDSLDKTQKALFAVLGTIFGAAVTGIITYKVGTNQGKKMPSTWKHDDYLEGRTNGVLQATKCQQPGPDSQTLERLMDLENRVSRTERSNYSNVSNW